MGNPYDYCDLCKEYDHIDDMYCCSKCNKVYCYLCKYIDDKIICDCENEDNMKAKENDVVSWASFYGWDESDYKTEDDD